jgi:dihydroorotase-like cyclic amidohydrolase
MRLGVAIAAAGALFAPGVHAQAPAKPPSRDFAVRCGTLMLGDGASVIENGWLVVRDGKVQSASTDAPPPELPVVDASGKVVMPGIVAVDNDLSGATDSDYQVTPDALAVDSFDFDSKHLDALQGGVTTAYLSPGRSRLVSGQALPVVALLRARLEKRDAPYAAVFQAIEALASERVELAAIREVVAAEVPDDTPEALDRAWEEAPVTFGNDASALDGTGCSAASAMVARFAQPSVAKTPAQRSGTR